MRVGRRQTPNGRKIAATKAKSRPASFRDEVVGLHRAIFQRNQALINESVTGYTPLFRRYEKRYGTYVQRYQRDASYAELDAEIARADVVYFGDYHTLPQAQRSVLRVLRRIPPERQVTLALEFVQGRYQHAIDAYMRDELDDEAFLKAIDHTAHWIFGGWESFRLLFEFAKQRGYAVSGIDLAARGKAGRSLKARDEYAAERIQSAMTETSNDLTIVLIGELHIAPPHLPLEVEKLCGSKVRQLIVYQNCEAIYRALERQGKEHETELVRISKGQYCLLNTPPIVCQQSFLNWLNIDDEMHELDAPEENVKNFASLIADFFDLPMGDALDELEVTTVIDLSFLNRLRRTGAFTPSDMRKIRQQIVRSESYYIPRTKMIYLGNLSVNHASEEATHFLRHVVSKSSQEPRLLVDAFYARCIEEAVGFLGSKLINHKRKSTTPADLTRLVRNRAASADEKRLARLVLRHLKMEDGKRVRGMLEIYECDADMFNAITHILGYYLGEKLYYGLVFGHIRKDDIRDLFFEDFAIESSALRVYLYWVMQTKEVTLPERL